MRRIVIALSATTLALGLTSCASGPNAATRMVNQVTDGVEKHVVNGNIDIKLTNFTLVATSNGDAVLVGTIANRGSESDVLLGVAKDGVKATITGLTDLNQNKPIFFEGDQANAKAVFAGANLQPGSRIDLNVGFGKSGLVRLNVLVRAQSDIYANIHS